jgi:hypothetical protein
MALALLVEPESQRATHSWITLEFVKRLLSRAGKVRTPESMSLLFDSCVQRPISCPRVRIWGASGIGSVQSAK